MKITKNRILLDGLPGINPIGSLSGMRKVGITGIGIVCPLGTGKEKVWDKLIGGEHGIRVLTNPRFNGLAARIAAVVPSEAIQAFLQQKTLASQPKFVQYALFAAEEAIRDADLQLEMEFKDEIGVSIGSGMSCVDEICEAARIFEARGQRRVSPHFIPRILGNMAGGHVCIQHGLRGPIFSPQTACATGASAVGEAFRSIRYGDAQVMLAGATEACIDPLSMAGFCQARALTTQHNDVPAEASRPFDRDRSGFVMGEGAAILILEELGRAKRRGAKILAEIVGYGTSADAHHITASHPEGLGARLAMSRALKEAGIPPSLVSYINAHGTSTPLGDRAELNAIKDVFSSNRSVMLSSTKGATGHLLSAAGAIEAAFTVLSLNKGVIPPNRNFRAPDDDVALAGIEINSEAKAIAIQYALSNSFGFGGMNVSLCFKAAGEN